MADGPANEDDLRRGGGDDTEETTSTSRKLLAVLDGTAGSRKPLVALRRGLRELPSLEGLIKDGQDPVHAAYVLAQNSASVFAETVSLLPVMRKYAKIVGQAEDVYLPAGPPMSPLTASYFTSWAFCDLRFDGTDTLATCQVAADELVGLGPGRIEALAAYGASRMGIYEHVGTEGRHVRLRELVTDAEFKCLATSGYRGRPGQIWYVRLLPPLRPETADHHVTFTTPYVLMRTSLADWMQFLDRGLSATAGGDRSERLHRFLKYGPEPNHWNEFVFRGYCGHQFDAIFLAGIPDLAATLPHA